MPTPHIIAVGASAGGFEGMRELFGMLPAELPAAVFAVLHIGAHRSRLESVLSVPGGMPAEAARHGEPIRAGRIFVAPSDHHVLVRDGAGGGTIELSRAPRENRTRPAIDPLFRSAARAFGPRVVAVLLSGTQGDGTVGLMAVKARGGLTVVQDPNEVLYAEMPSRAIRYAEVHHVLPLAEIGRLLAGLNGEGATTDEPATPSGQEPESPPLRDLAAQARDERENRSSVYSCSDCGGVLWQIEEHGATSFHCHVGHAYAAAELHLAKSEELEGALWSAVRALTERAALARQRASRLRSDGYSAEAEALLEQARADEANLRAIRDQILGAAPPSGAHPAVWSGGGEPARRRT